MKKLILAASVCLTLFSSLQCIASEEMTNVREITIIHRAIGRMRVLVAPDAVKVYILNNQTEMVSRAPDWHVVISRPSVKLCMTYNSKQWQVRSIGILDGKPPAILHYVQSAPYKFEGEQLTLLKGVAEETKTEARYLVMQKQTPQELNAVLVRMFRLPKVDGLPLAYEETSGESFAPGATAWLASSRKLNESRRQIKVMDLSAMKKVKVPPRDLDYPKGFKSTLDERDIMITNGRSEMMNALTNFGFEPSKPEAKSTQANKKKN